MGYIEDMRALIGHELLITASVAVLVVDGRRVLLQRRRDNGLWAMHGGMLEIGEAFEDAARRELYEETGLTAGRLELCGLASGPDRIYTYPNGDKVYAVGAVYLCREYSGKLRAQPEEVAHLEWFDADALPELSPPEARQILQLARRIAREYAQAGAAPSKPGAETAATRYDISTVEDM